MRCNACGQENDSIYKFCMNCGAELAGCKCVACGADIHPGATFCGKCGAKQVKPQEIPPVKTMAGAKVVMRYATPESALQNKHKSTQKIILIVLLLLVVLGAGAIIVCDYFGIIPIGIWHKDDSDYLCFTALEPDVTVAITRENDAPEVSLQYSTDRKNWREFVVGQTEVWLENEGDKVWFRGDNPRGFSACRNVGNHFDLIGRVASSGSVMSLLNAENFNKMNAVPVGAFQNLFWNCTSLETAPELPAKKLGFNCYDVMFNGCTSLEIAPELPAKKLAHECYFGMFAYCTSLEAAPELPAKKLAYDCYSMMFLGCTSLEIAPELPAKKLADGCYSRMFKDCTSLESVTVGFDAFTDLPGYAIVGWLENVAETGTFIWRGSDFCGERGESTVPARWDIVSAD